MKAPLAKGRKCNMRKGIRLLLLLLCTILVAFVFSGCENTKVQVENLISMNAQFKGSRSITVNTGFVFEGKEDLKNQFDEVVNEYCPSVFKREVKSADDGLKYIFTIEFESKKDYINKISAVLGRQAGAALGTPDSDLARGWHLKEDFDGMELIKWLQDGIAEKKYNDINFEFESTSNIVNFDGDIQSSQSSQIDINTVEGYPVTAVSIETTNNKKDSYDRRFTLSVPQSTYDKMGKTLQTIMRERTTADAVYSGWTQQGNNQEFQILYQGITAAQLQRVTSLFLDCKETSIYYGDENNSSTPLAEQLVFEENIDVLSFVPKKDGEVAFSYKYSLPLRTTHGEGLVFNQGVWEKQGSWIDGVYTLNSRNKAFTLRIPDGIQYDIEGLAVTLENNGADSFTRSFDFLYDKKTGEEGRNYAYQFFKKQGVSAEQKQTNDALICRIVMKGTAHQINHQLDDLFGGGNTFERTEKTSTMAVVTDINLKDSIRLSYMLTGDNADVPFTYTLINKGGENIISLNGEGEPKKDSAAVAENDGTYRITLQGGENTAELIATVPYVQGIATYCIVAGVMFLIAMLLILFFIRKTRRLKIKEEQEQQRRLREEAFKKEMEKEPEKLPGENTSFPDDF